MRKVLEQENICASLKGRIQYFATRYRGAHDQTGRVAIRLDGKEILKSDCFDWSAKQHDIWSEITANTEGKISYLEFSESINTHVQNQGGIGQYAFYRAFHAYHNSSIDESLQSLYPLVRLLAILDKRVGKRRLQKLVSEVEAQPEWLQPFYQLRMEADGITM